MTSRTIFHLQNIPDSLLCILVPPRYATGEVVAFSMHTGIDRLMAADTRCHALARQSFSKGALSCYSWGEIPRGCENWVLQLPGN